MAHCPNCGTDTPAGDRYCRSCGLALTKAAAPRPPEVVAWIGAIALVLAPFLPWQGAFALIPLQDPIGWTLVLAAPPLCSAVLWMLVETGRAGAVGHKYFVVLIAGCCVTLVVAAALLALIVSRSSQGLTIGIGLIAAGLGATLLLVALARRRGAGVPWFQVAFVSWAWGFTTLGLLTSIIHSQDPWPGAVAGSVIAATISAFAVVSVVVLLLGGPGGRLERRVRWIVTALVAVAYVRYLPGAVAANLDAMTRAIPTWETPETSTLAPTVVDTAFEGLLAFGGAAIGLSVALWLLRLLFAVFGRVRGTPTAESQV